MAEGVLVNVVLKSVEREGGRRCVGGCCPSFREVVK